MPHTGAKGLNLAATDAKYLACALTDYFRDGIHSGIDQYSERCLRGVWHAERFSWWFTNIMHRIPEGGPIATKFQMAELDYLLNSPAALATLAENHVGLPMTFGD